MLTIADLEKLTNFEDSWQFCFSMVLGVHAKIHT